MECFDKARSEQCCQSVRLRWIIEYFLEAVITSVCTTKVGRLDWCLSLFVVGRLHHGWLQQWGQYNPQQQVCTPVFLFCFLTIHNHRPFPRRVYRQIDGDSFLYYWDWGPNSGIKIFQKWVCWSYWWLQELTGWCPMNGGKEKGNLWHLSFFRFKILILHEMSKLLY